MLPSEKLQGHIFVFFISIFTTFENKFKKNTLNEVFRKEWVLFGFIFTAYYKSH
jgi:hypothetical protein